MIPSGTAVRRRGSGSQSSRPAPPRDGREPVGASPPSSARKGRRAAADRFGAGSVAPHPGTQVPAGSHVAAGTV